MKNADRKRELGKFMKTVGDVHSHGVCRSFLGGGGIKIRGGNLEEK